MKKVLFTLSLLVFTLASYAQVTEPSDNVISVADFSIKVGKSVNFAVSLDNPTATNLAGIQLKVTVPDGFTITDSDEETWALTDRTKGFNVYIKATSTPNVYLLSIYANKAITEHSGPVLWATLNAPADAVAGQTYDFTFDTAIAGNLDKVDQDCPDGSFKVTVVADQVDLYDTATELPAASSQPENVVLHRDFKANVWNTLVVPFDVDAAGVKAAFGDDVLLAEFSGWAGPSYQGEENEIALTFSTVNVITANTPLLIKPSTAKTEVNFAVSGINPIVDDERGFASADVTYMVKVGKVQVPYTSAMVGTYKKTSIVVDEDEYYYPIFLNNNKLYYAKAEQTIKGYRAWFELFDNPYYENAEIKMLFDVDGETAIMAVENDVESGKTYSIDGKYLGENVKLNRMQKGVYIVNGKKVINK